MIDDARSDGPGPTAGRRPARRWAVVVGAALVLGGGTALAVGVRAQQPDPPRPVAATTAPLPVPSPSVPAPSVSEPAPAPEQPLPVQVSIPSLDIASDLITVGVQPDGTLEVPQPGPDYDRAAWFDGSPRPGGTGPAVIEGHVDGVDGPSVFHELGRVAVGSQVLVARADGTTATFVVDAVRSFSKDDFPTLEVYGNTAGPELRLLTCGGRFDRSTGHYTDNTVVFAHLST
ncbi:class F sortase [Cellulomonas sp. ICMP 17802]|uniref:class F sortase n=1 Tax=Cellulomonas sp. ICMP 17802 TaxID=3239199 RepID=UPI00351AC3AE